MDFNNNLLTPLELKIMNILWRIKKGFVNDILDHWETDEAEKKPAYNTVSTVVRILKDKKQFIGHEAHGRSHQYFPLISKAAYQRKFLSNTIDNLFAGSFSTLVSTFVDAEPLSAEDLEALRALIEEQAK